MISKRLSPTPFAKAEIYPEIDFWRKSTKKSILERTFSFVFRASESSISYIGVQQNVEIDPWHNHQKTTNSRACSNCY